MITIVYLIAAMTTILLLTEQNFRKKRGYIIFDHIDIQVEVESVPFEKISKAPKGESSAAIRERVLFIWAERYLLNGRSQSVVRRPQWVRQYGAR